MDRYRMQTVASLALFVLLATPIASRQLLGLSEHKYGPDEDVKLWANKVGPFSNPSETYQYYTLPFCTPKTKVEYKPEGLGEVLEGDRLVNTPYTILFRSDKENEVLCSRQLNNDEVQSFRKAVKKDYYYQMFLDELPIWGFIGRAQKVAGGVAYYLFTHIHFEVLYNSDRVIEVNVATDPHRTVDITEDKPITVDFTYSVKWKETNVTFERRMEKYQRYAVNKHHLEVRWKDVYFCTITHSDVLQIHWFSIVNSCVTVLLLTGFLATILMRVLKHDFIKYTHDDEAGEDQEETGWKYIHGDVFRFPAHLNLFCAAIGTGTQIFVMALCIFALGLLQTFHPTNRGALLAACVVLYALTAGVAGYVAGASYKVMGGTNWVRNVLLTCVLFCGPMLVMFSFLNTVAFAYGSTQALPWQTIVIIILLWALVTFPLTVLGGIAGKNTRAEFNAPCRTTKYPREIPPLPWYRTTPPQMVMAGFLPFSAIYIELYYIFASMWGHKDYVGPIYPILFIVFIILLIVTAFITIALTYFQLAVEDYRWWWRSMMCGGATAFFVYGYCFYYYFARSDMSAFMQTSFFFGYMFMVCYAFFLMLGMVGYRASLLFVRHIYKAIKCE